MKRSGPPARRTPLARGPLRRKPPADGDRVMHPVMTLVTRRKRSAADDRAKFAHEYGSAKRVAWIAWTPCLGCGTVPCENAHTANGGTGKKGHHSTIVPLCTPCHGATHQHGVQTFERNFARSLEGHTLKAWAARIHARWLARDETDEATEGAP